MRAIGSCALVVVLLPACTRLNPAFDVGEDDGEAGEVTNGGATTSSQVTSSEVGDATRTTSPDPSAEGPVSADASATTEVAVDSGVLDTGLLDTGGCAPEFPAPFGITSMPPLDLLVGCPGVESLFIDVQTVSPLGDVTGILCAGEMCPCPKEPVVPIVLGFDAPVPTGLLGCTELRLDLDAECGVIAYMILTGGPPPRAVVSNIVNPLLGHPFLISLDVKAPIEECSDGGCAPASGRYPLIEENTGLTIVPNETSVLPGPLTYAITNAGSGIDADCNEVARWYALLDP
jgi:hypothetical protein